MNRTQLSRYLLLALALTFVLGCAKKPSHATPESLCNHGKEIYGGTEEAFYKDKCLEETRAFKEEAELDVFIDFAECVYQSEAPEDFRLCAKKLRAFRVKVQRLKMAAMGKALGEIVCQCQIALEKTHDKKVYEACLLEQRKLKQAFDAEVERITTKQAGSSQWQIGKPMSGDEIIHVMKAARDARKDADKACHASPN